MTFPKSPLYNLYEEYSVSDTVQYIIDMGMPPEKIMLGFGNFGFSFTLASRLKTKIGSPVIGLGKAGKVKKK